MVLNVLMGTAHSIWHTFQQKGVWVPRSAVEEIVLGLDTEGVKETKAQRLLQRVYMSRPE